MTLHSDEDNPAPDGAYCATLTTPDGVNLRYARWRPKGKCLGTISLFHGRCEFIEKYYEVIDDLLNMGFAVATLDWRGQGGSQRLTRNKVRGHVRRFSDYDKDILAFVENVVLPDCPAPHFAVGHSMGGHILLRNAIKGRLPFERMVLSAPMLALPPTFLPWPVAHTLCRVMSLIGLGHLSVPGGRAHGVRDVAFEGNPLTHDEVRYGRYRRLVTDYPELEINAPSFGWLGAALNSMAQVNTEEFARKIDIPTLIVSAGEDLVVNILEQEDFGAWMKAGHTVRIPRASHELMMEDDGMREQFFAALKAFLPGEAYFTQEELELIGRRRMLEA